MKWSYFLILFVFLGQLAFADMPPTPDELKKIDTLVGRGQNLWDEVCKDFAEKHGIPPSKIPQKLPTIFENEIRGQTRETLTKSYNGQFDWQTPMRAVYENYLLYKMQSRRRMTPGEVVTLERGKDPKFDPAHLKLINLGQELWAEFRLLYLKKYGLKPEAIPKVVPKHFKILASKTDESKIDEIEKQWDDKFKDKLLDAYLQYAGAHYYNTGVQGKRDIDARSMLEGKERARPEPAVTSKELPSAPQIEEKIDIKGKLIKYGPFILIAIFILVFILKK